MRHPGDIAHRYRDGREIRFSPSQGSSTRYVVTCPHGGHYNARTLADAREMAADLKRGDCPDCSEAA